MDDLLEEDARIAHERDRDPNDPIISDQEMRKELFEREEHNPLRQSNTLKDVVVKGDPALPLTEDEWPEKYREQQREKKEEKNDK